MSKEDKILDELLETIFYEVYPLSEHNRAKQRIAEAKQQILDNFISKERVREVIGGMRKEDFDENPLGIRDNQAWEVNVQNRLRNQFRAELIEKLELGDSDV